MINIQRSLVSGFDRLTQNSSTMKFFGAIVVAVVCSMAGANPLPANNEIPPLISFKDGTIGVNFLGYHASAGLGGLLGGNGGAGGLLHAEAGTPFGQRAAAGLGGSVGQNGRANGELYAGATAGGNVKAAAGLGGGIDGGNNPIANGGLYSAASAGSAASGSSIAGETSNGRTYKRISKIGAPKKRVNTYVSDENDTQEEDVPVVYTQKKTRVRPVKFDKYAISQEETPAVATKHVSYESSPSAGYSGFGTGFLNAFLSAPSQQVPSYAHSTTVEKSINHGGQKNPSFFEDIFNIPISTLGAVSKFLSNSASGSNLNVQKSYTSH